MNELIDDYSLYFDMLDKTSTLVNSAQEKVITNANEASMEMRVGLGELISENTEKYSWGEKVIEKLSADLKLKFQNSSGFSASNLRIMRQLYSEYKDYPKLLEIAKKVRWRTNIAIMQKVKSLISANEQNGCAVKQRPNSVVREICALRCVGVGSIQMALPSA